MVEKNICTSNKRYYLYLSILQKVYRSLKMDRPMTVGLPVAFDELPYINNNVGLIILQYDITDTMEIFEKKMKNAFYQVYVSNLIINLPFPNISVFRTAFEIRDYIDCIISTMYIKSDLDFKFGWNCSKFPLEQMYVGSVSIIRNDNTMDINSVFTTRSMNYTPIKTIDSIEHFFDS